MVVTECDYDGTVLAEAAMHGDSQRRVVWTRPDAGLSAARGALFAAVQIIRHHQVCI